MCGVRRACARAACAIGVPVGRARACARDMKAYHVAAALFIKMLDPERTKSVKHATPHALIVEALHLSRYLIYV